jgi:hypothetical protein
MLKSETEREGGEFFSSWESRNIFMGSTFYWAQNKIEQFLVGRQQPAKKIASKCGKICESRNRPTQFDLLIGAMPNQYNLPISSPR